MGMMENGRDLAEKYSGCNFQMLAHLPQLYPPTTETAAVAVAGHANAHTWGVYADIMPAATIDADSSQTHFFVDEMDIHGLTNNSKLYFELQYNSETVGRGHIFSRGTGTNTVRGSDFNTLVIAKVTGQALKMRIMSNQAAESVDVGPINWCEGVP